MELYSQQDPLVLNSSTESLGMSSSILRGKKTCGGLYLRENLLCRILIRDGLDARKKGGTGEICGQLSVIVSASDGSLVHLNIYPLVI